MFDPETFGKAMGEAIRKAIEPLHAKIAELEKQLADKPDLAGMIAEAVKSIPIPKDGQSGKDGKDCDMEAVKAMIQEAVKSIPVINGKDGKDGKDGERGPQGEKGADGIGAAGAMIDRDGNLLITLTNGEVKSLGLVVGKDGQSGTNGVDGKDGISLESFDLEYLSETHEIQVKASCAGRVKEIRYPAGGIRAKGYWRDGTKAKSGEVWALDGNSWTAIKDTSSKPEAMNQDWILSARKGRDGESVVRNAPAPAGPIKLGGDK